MSSPIHVSFVTCVYNQKPSFFKECAASVSAQDGSVEWIVVDDGSAPESLAIHRKIVEAVATSVKTRFVALPNNVGLSAARNEAFALAQGDWIVVLDSDDLAGVTLTRLLSSLPETFAIACFEVNYFEHYKVEHRRLAFFEKLFKDYAGTTLDPFLWFDFYYHGIILRRNLLKKIGGYPTKLKVGEDQDILLRALETVKPDQVAFINEVGYEYRSNSDGVCRQRWHEVLTNYTNTMLEGAIRRGASFNKCRFGGTKNVDGAVIDYYEYLTDFGLWVSWDSWQIKQQISIGSVL